MTRRVTPRYLLPLAAIAAGVALWHAGYPTPGAPRVLLWENAWAVLAADRGVLYVATHEHDSVWIVERKGDAVWRVPRYGRPERVAGGGRMWSPTKVAGDGGPAMRATLHWPAGLALDRHGNLFIAESFGTGRVRRIDAGGKISTTAGVGSEGFSGDGGPAAKAHLSQPGSVAVERSGSLLVADRGNGRVRRISPEGIIGTVAGGGRLEGCVAEGRPATEAKLGVSDVAAAPDGSFSVAEGWCGRRVWRVDTAGRISAVAGTGAEGSGGDGGPAIQARLAVPDALAFDESGNLYVGDSQNGSVRKVDPQGAITRVAGDRWARDRWGSFAWSHAVGEGGPALRAPLYVDDICLDKRGNLYVADPWVGVRRISPNGLITTVVVSFPRLSGGHE